MDIHGFSEDVFGFVWDRDGVKDTDVTQLMLPHAYISREKAAMEKEFVARRVRSVHYRNQPIKVIENLSNGIIKELAFCADKDFAVENFKIPREFPHYDTLCNFFSQIGATKELLFSKYLPSYLGFDDASDQYYNQYFFEIKKGKSLKRILSETSKTLIDYELLFKYWIKELLYAFRDLVYRCTYTVESPITLKNIYTSDYGIKIHLKNVKFAEQRDDNLSYHLHMESTFLRMFARLLIEMLTNRDDYVDFDNMEIDPQLKCILYECYHAKDKTDHLEQKRYEDNINDFIYKEKEKAHLKERE